MALQNSNQYTIEKPTDQMITGHEQTTSTNTTSAATTAAEVKDNEQVKPVSPASESDEQSEEDQPTMDDIGEEEHSADVWDGGSSNTESNDNGTDDFFEDNKELLKKIKNILDFVYPNSKISLAELLTSVKGYVIKYAQNLGGGGDNDDADPKLPPEGDDVTAPIEPGADGETVKPSEEDKINELIAKGFCKIYNTSLDEFSKVVNAELFGNDIYGFECKKPDDQKEIANAVNIDRYNAEFDKQDNVRIDQLFKAVNAIVDELKNNMPNDQYNAKTIIAPIANYCQSNDTVVLNYISYLLKVFYDKWLLPDGSGDRFPYVIYPTDTAGREKAGSTVNATWNDVKNYIIEEEKNFIEDKEKEENIYDFQYYSAGKEDYDGSSRYGKGSPEMMQRVASMLLTKYTSSNNSTFKKHLHDLGIGMDCSGYVSRALSFVMEKLRIDKETQLKTLGKGYDGKLKSNATTIRVNVKEEDKAQTKQKWYLSSKSGSTLLVYEPKTINSKELKTIEDLQSTYTFTNKNTQNTVDKILKLKLVKITHSTNDKTGIDKIHIVSVSDENISKDITKLQPGDIMTTTSSEGYFHIRLIYEADGKGGFFKHHQSGSENRQGVVETYVDNSNISKQTQNYWFARPNVFKDPKKLRGFFIDMLKYKGGST